MKIYTMLVIEKENLPIYLLLLCHTFYIVLLFIITLMIPEAKEKQNVNTEKIAVY